MEGWSTDIRFSPSTKTFPLSITPMNNLNHYASNTYSQYGEDGIIKRIFEILPPKEIRWCVEFGAWDGKFLSNTHELLANRSWKGVLIEGNPKKIPALNKTYQGNSNAILLNRFVSFESPNTLDDILKETDIPLDFDLLSIDIDGNDYHVWESVKTYHPAAVVIEFNPTIPSDIEFVQEKNFTLNQGNSLLSLVKLGKEKGYELIATTFCNGFFVRKDLFGLFELSDNRITSLWETEKPAPRIFQLYDGTLVLSEKFKLHWHQKIVTEYQLQALPKSLRFFEDSPTAMGLYRRILRRVYYLLQAKKNKNS